MTTIVIMPGGFHPWHGGHTALYQSAQQAFPDAEVFVAATNDTSARPFPFAVKEKLAQLAGVAPGYFVQVKSPFRAEEITSKFDPARDRLIFVRSEKDANKPPQAGGAKRDGSAAYLQLLAGQTNIRPFKEHAYMAYLPTVEFGPGMTSATEIRTAWPTLNEKRKTALVMSLYPRTQSNPKLANTVVKILDAAIGTQDVAEGSDDNDTAKTAYMHGLKHGREGTGDNMDRAQAEWGNDFKHYNAGFLKGRNQKAKSLKAAGQGYGRRDQGRAATLEHQDYIEEKWSQKYKSSVNCANPQGFSQKAHCAGRKK